MGMAGRIVVKSITSGTIVQPAGATLYSLAFHASAGGATVTIGAQDAIAVINGANPTVLMFPEDMFDKPGNIVAVNTDSITAVFKIVGST